MKLFGIDGGTERQGYLYLDLLAVTPGKVRLIWLMDTDQMASQMSQYVCVCVCQYRT